jgi:hypothetical protein
MRLYEEFDSIVYDFVESTLGAVHKGRPHFLGGEGVPNCRRLPTLGGEGSQECRRLHF